MNCSPQSLVSAARCFASCIPQRGIHPVKNYLLCQIANVGLKSVPTPTGLVFSFQGTGLNVSLAWNAGPNPSTTEVWTSLDNVTFSLAGTTPNFFTNTWVFTPPPTINQILYAKIRFNKSGAVGQFSPVVVASGRTVDWLARIGTNGGAGNSTLQASRQAVNGLYLALNSAGLDTLMLTGTAVVDSLVATLTPLFKVKGADPWVNHNFVQADITINGMLGDGATKYLQTGMFVSDFPAMGNGGATAYCTAATNTVNIDFGYLNGNAGFTLEFDNGGSSFFIAWDTTNGICSGANALWTGYLSGNRTANNLSTLYKANSSVAHTTLATDNTLITIDRVGASEIYAWAVDNAGVPQFFSDRRISFFMMHSGLTSAQSQTFFNAVQAYRQAVGGGFV